MRLGLAALEPNANSYVCHFEAPPGCLNEAFLSVAIKAGHIMVTPGTPGT